MLEKNGWFLICWSVVEIHSTFLRGPSSKDPPTQSHHPQRVCNVYVLWCIELWTDHWLWFVTKLTVVVCSIPLIFFPLWNCRNWHLFKNVDAWIGCWRINVSIIFFLYTELENVMFEVSYLTSFTFHASSAGVMHVKRNIVFCFVFLCWSLSMLWSMTSKWRMVNRRLWSLVVLKLWHNHGLIASDVDRSCVQHKLWIVPTMHVQYKYCLVQEILYATCSQGTRQLCM